MHPISPFRPTREQIWNYRQNRPTLVARDLELYGVPREITHRVLLSRGVYKWLAVRRDIIKLKNVWRDRITSIIADIRRAKRDQDRDKLLYLRGYLRAHEECRAAVRAMCHSDRWRAPDFDQEAQTVLSRLEGESNAAH